MKRIIFSALFLLSLAGVVGAAGAIEQELVSLRAGIIIGGAYCLVMWLCVEAAR